VEKHLASLLAAWDAIPMPSVRVIQAPVFTAQLFGLGRVRREPVSKR